MNKVTNFISMFRKDMLSMERIEYIASCITLLLIIFQHFLYARNKGFFGIVCGLIVVILSSWRLVIAITISQSIFLIVIIVFQSMVLGRELFIRNVQKESNQKA